MVEQLGANMDKCYCGKTATTYVDSDSAMYIQTGMPVCDEHAEGMDPLETFIPPPQI